MNMITATALRNDLYNSLDRVAETGVPVVVERKGKRVMIVAADKVDKFKNLKQHKAIVGDPNELVDIKTHEWSKDKNL